MRYCQSSYLCLTCHRVGHGSCPTCGSHAPTMSLRTPIAKALTQPKGVRKEAKRQKLTKELIEALMTREGVNELSELHQNLYFNPPIHHLGKPWGHKPYCNQQTGFLRRRH